MEWPNLNGIAVVIATAVTYDYSECFTVIITLRTQSQVHFQSLPFLKRFLHLHFYLLDLFSYVLRRYIISGLESLDECTQCLTLIAPPQSKPWSSVSAMFFVVRIQ